MKYSTSKKTRQFGQGMTEYIIITALISIAGIVVVNQFGGVVKGQFGHMASQLSGSASQESLKAAGNSGESARNEGGSKHNLAKYGATRN